MKGAHVMRTTFLTRTLSNIVTVPLAILGVGLALLLAAFSMWAVVIVERQITLEMFGEALGPTGLEYFIGPVLLFLVLFGVIKITEIRPNKKQKNTVLDFRLRSHTALSQQTRDWDELDRLFKEGLVYQSKWGANKELNETVGTLRYFVEQHSARQFIAKLRD